MKLEQTALRKLVKSYTNGLINRKQYLDIREQMLKKLEISGSVTEKDLQNFLKIHEETEQRFTLGSYSRTDWIIIVLGLLAALSLGLILYD